jgi:hypothetical protein
MVGNVSLGKGAGKQATGTEEILMPRLIDDLRTPGSRLAVPHFVLPERVAAWQTLTTQLVGLLADPALPVLTLDATSRFLYTDSGQETWDLARDFPNLTPPFPVFWCEHAIPERIHSFACGDTDVTPWVRGGRVGVLVHGLERSAVTGEGIPANVCWVLWCELFIDYRHPGIAATGPHGSIFLAVDAHGRIVDIPWMQSFAGPADAEMMKSLMGWLHPTFLAMQYLAFNPAARAAAAATCGAEL